MTLSFSFMFTEWRKCSGTFILSIYLFHKYLPNSCQVPCYRWMGMQKTPPPMELTLSWDSWYTDIYIIKPQIAVVTLKIKSGWLKIKGHFLQGDRGRLLCQWHFSRDSWSEEVNHDRFVERALKADGKASQKALKEKKRYIHRKARRPGF